MTIRTIFTIFCICIEVLVSITVEAVISVKVGLVSGALTFSCCSVEKLIGNAMLTASVEFYVINFGGRTSNTLAVIE